MIKSDGSDECDGRKNIFFMQTEFRFRLDKGSKKYHCPQCGKKTFVRFIDIEKAELIPEQYGRCDRESKCNYYLNPYLDGYAKEIWKQEQGQNFDFKNFKKRNYVARCYKETEPIFFDFETFKKTLKGYEENVFIQNLISSIRFPFPIDEVVKVIELYRLGTVTKGYRKGATTFPFIDINGNVRTIQVKQFDEHNHTKGTDFLHSIIERNYKLKNECLPNWLQKYIDQEKRVSCLFGEHLLKQYPNNPIALVEAPKTAIYGSLYFGNITNESQLIWLAVYNKSSFSFDKLKILEGREIYVFPDLSKDGSTFQEWKHKAKNYESKLINTTFIFSDLLERLAPQHNKNEGSDLADFLIQHDWRNFRK